MASVQIAGLASGLNWQNIINQLIQADSASVNQVKAQQTTINNQVTALGSINTDLGSLSNSIFSLEDPSAYSGVTVTSDVSNSTWAVNANQGTSPGAYAIDVSLLATASQLDGATGVSAALNGSNDVSGLTVANLSTAQPVTAGTFTVNGQQIAITTSESLQAVFDAIGSATGGTVTASYNAATDKVSLTSSAGPIVLGAANDTSDLLQQLKLVNNGSSTVTSAGTLGRLNLSSNLAGAGTKAALTGQDGSGNGSFTINGVTVGYNVNNDSLSTLLTRIDNSGAGVTASYDSSADQVVLTNSSTGAVGITATDTSGNLLAALGLTSGAGGSVALGRNSQFSVNNGPSRTSQSNALGPADLGIPGLNVTANSTGLQHLTVAVDSSAIQTGIQSFITAFNKVQADISGDTKIGADSNGNPVTSILSSDHEVGDWASQLEMTAFGAGSALSGPIKSLDAMGIDFNGTTGQLQISDQGTFLQAVQNNPSQVAAFFQTATTGFGAVMNSAITDIQRQDNADQSNLQSESSDLANQITTMQNQLTAEQNNLEAEFTAMEQAESRFQSEMTTLGGIGGSTASGSSATASNNLNNNNVYVNGTSASSTSSSGSGTTGG
jgi:flagellar hook-associated protein 2